MPVLVVFAYIACSMKVESSNEPNAVIKWLRECQHYFLVVQPPVAR